VSEIRIGLNQAGRGLSGHPSLDSCMAGVVSLGMGNNEMLGGNVRSTLSLGLPASRVSLHAGDILLVDAGSLAEAGSS
jgi:hypothetical protein